MPESFPTWPVASASLLAGFAVADVTGVRPLGGLVLVAAAGWCAVRWHRRRGAPTAAALTIVYAGGFAASHALADTLGAWGAVATVAAVAGAAAWALADSRPPRAAVSSPASPSARPAGP